MPQQRNPCTLQSICLEPLAEMLWDWWLTSKGRLVIQLEEIFMYFKLPRYYTEEILTMLIENHEVYTGHLCLLIKLGMRHLTLTKLYYVDFETVLQKCGTCFQNFYHLDLSRCRVPLKILSTIPQIIPNICVFRLQFTQTTNKILGLIADHCPQLQDLDVSYCQQITNEGVEKLCSSTSVCRKTLTKLNIVETRVTTAGAGHFLKNTPALVELDFQNAVDLFVAMHAMDLHRGKFDESMKYNLRVLKFNLDPKCHRMRRPHHNMNDDFELVSEAFHIVVMTCPLLTTALVSEWNPHQPGSLHLLSHCMQLTELEFSVKDYPTLSMDDIQPILDNRGEHLTSLTLRHVINVNVINLCTVCIRLKTLHMDDNSYLIISSPRLTLYFNCLIKFTLVGNVPDETLYQLLITCTHAQDVVIYYNYNFRYELLRNVFASNSFSNLETLDFAECDSFTDEALQLFIQDENNLSKIRIENCRISYNQYFQVINWIRKNQPTTDIDFDFKSRIC